MEDPANTTSLPFPSDPTAGRLPDLSSSKTSSPPLPETSAPEPKPEQANSPPPPPTPPTPPPTFVFQKTDAGGPATRKSKKPFLIGGAILVLLLISTALAVYFVQKGKFGVQEKAAGCPPASCSGTGYLCADGCDCNWSTNKGVRWYYKCNNGVVEKYNEYDSSCDSSCPSGGGGGGGITCGADGSGIWVKNNGTSATTVAVSWFASYCDRTDCFCSGSPNSENFTLQPGQTITRGFTNSHPACNWSWQTDVTAGSCHQSAHGCGSEPCTSPTPTSCTAGAESYNYFNDPATNATLVRGQTYNIRGWAIFCDLKTMFQIDLFQCQSGSCKYIGAANKGLPRPDTTAYCGGNSGANGWDYNWTVPADSYLGQVTLHSAAIETNEKVGSVYKCVKTVDRVVNIVTPTATPTPTSTPIPTPTPTSKPTSTPTPLPACVNVQVSATGGDLNNLKIGDSLTFNVTFSGTVEDVGVVIKKDGVRVQTLTAGGAKTNSWTSPAYTIESIGSYEVSAYVKVNGVWQ